MFLESRESYSGYDVKKEWIRIVQNGIYALFVCLDMAHLTTVGTLALSADRFLSSWSCRIRRARRCCFTSISPNKSFLLIASNPTLFIPFESREFFLNSRRFVSITA